MMTLMFGESATPVSIALAVTASVAAAWFAAPAVMDPVTIELDECHMACDGQIKRWSTTECECVAP